MRRITLAAAKLTGFLICVWVISVVTVCGGSLGPARKVACSECVLAGWASCDSTCKNEAGTVVIGGEHLPYVSWKSTAVPMNSCRWIAVGDGNADCYMPSPTQSGVCGVKKFYSSANCPDEAKFHEESILKSLCNDTVFLEGNCNTQS